MNEPVTQGLIANFLYDCARGGISLSFNFIKERLGNIILNESKVEEIAEEVLRLHESENLKLYSKEGIKAMIERNQELMNIINSLSRSEIIDNNISQVHSGEGDNVVIFGSSYKK